MSPARATTAFTASIAPALAATAFTAALAAAIAATAFAAAVAIITASRPPRGPPRPGGDVVDFAKFRCGERH